MAKSNASSHLTFWFAAVATGPFYIGVFVWSVGRAVGVPLDEKLEGPGQAAQALMLILTPVVLIAACRGLYLMGRGRATRADKVLTIAGAGLVLFPYAFGVGQLGLLALMAGLVIFPYALGALIG